MDAIHLNAKSSAALIRSLLKRAFPATKFRVVTERGSMVSSVRIAWTDGPTAGRVEEIVGCFESGSFDGMTDSFTYLRGADKYLIIDGQTYVRGVRYVFTSREITPELANRCIRQVAEYWGGVDVIPLAVPTKWGHGYELVPDIGRSPVRPDLSHTADDWHSCIHQAAGNRTRFTRPLPYVTEET